MPDKYGFFEFYTKPIRNLMHTMHMGIKVHLLGYWYCAHCRKYHTARTKRFDISGGMSDDVCSLYDRSQLPNSPLARAAIALAKNMQGIITRVGGQNAEQDTGEREVHRDTV